MPMSTPQAARAVDQAKQGLPTTTCPQCGFEGEPIDALYFLDVAAMLVPMTYDSLRKFLSRHRDEFPPRYGKYGTARRRQRLLTGREIMRIREKLVSGPKTERLHDVLRRGIVFPEGSEDGTKANHG